MIFRLLYDLSLHLYALSMVPQVLRKRAQFPLEGRLGRGFPHIEKGGRPLVWVHAVSLGETKAIAPLLTKIKAHHSHPLVLLTTATKTGHAEGKKTEADYTAYLPLDISYLIRPLVRKIRPALVLITETDFWYNFQTAAAQCGATLILVNGKLSERSYRRYRLFPYLARTLLKPFHHFYVQGALYATRIQNLQIPSDKITVTGNIKLDAPLETAASTTLRSPDDYVITLGSTHAPEEQIWIEALKKVWKTHPHIKVLLVPRHPERFNEVAQLLHDENITFTRWSEGGTLHQTPVLLVDTMGVLRTCYQVSDLAFVGGSFTPHVGGHNIIEPAFYGKPVLFGPYMHSQPDLVDLVRTYKAGLQIRPEDIIPTLLAAPTLRQLGENGLKLVTESRGALERTFNGLLPLLEKIGS